MDFRMRWVFRLDWRLSSSQEDCSLYEVYTLRTVCVSEGFVLYCGRVPAANALGCTAAEGLLYNPWSLVLPTCIARCHHQRA